MTTEKDWVRLDPDSEAAARLMDITEQFPVIVRFDEELRLENLIAEMLARRPVSGGPE